MSQDKRASCVKICPQCGSKLFADMNICYGCLYEFDNNNQDNLERFDSVDYEQYPEADDYESQESSWLPPDYDFGGEDLTPDNKAPEATCGCCGVAPSISSSKYQVRLGFGPADIVLPILEKSLYLGSSSDNDVVVRDAQIEKRSARIYLKEGKPVIDPLSNLTFMTLNGLPLQCTQVLQNHDCVFIGGVRLEIIAREHA